MGYTKVHEKESPTKKVVNLPIARATKRNTNEYMAKYDIPSFFFLGGGWNSVTRWQFFFTSDYYFSERCLSFWWNWPWFYSFSDPVCHGFNSILIPNSIPSVLAPSVWIPSVPVPLSCTLWLCPSSSDTSVPVTPTGSLSRSHFFIFFIVFFFTSVTSGG